MQFISLSKRSCPKRRRGLEVTRLDLRIGSACRRARFWSMRGL